jgi:hypothetical protein
VTLERLRSWSYHRQLLGRLGATPMEALRTVVAVYSTHPTAPLALLARTRDLQRSDLAALEQQKQAVRIVAMRGSAFMVPTEMAARILAATVPSAEQLGSLLRPRGLNHEMYARLTPLVLECCSRPVTPTELRACATSDEDVYMVARVLARQGRVLRVGASLRTDQLKYVATAAWLGAEFALPNSAAALAWLAGEYVRAFGPVRVADFAWWAGVSHRVAAAAFAGLDLAECGDGLLILREDLTAFQRCRPLSPEAVVVLPKWDSYTMGYAPDGRQRLVEDRFLGVVYTSVAGSPGATAGDGLALVLQGGRAIATWAHRFSGDRLTVAVSPFEGERISDHVFDAVGELLSASSLTVTPGPGDPGRDRSEDAPLAPDQGPSGPGRSSRAPSA